MKRINKYKDIILGFEFEVDSSSLEGTYKFIDEMAPITGYSKHVIKSYHMTKSETAKGRWRVETDPSIDGAEFISPPMPYIEAKDMVKKVFEIMQNSKNITINDRCGLHVGISVNGNVDNLNLSGFLYSLNQSYIASLWPSRLINTNNDYVRTIKSQLRKFRGENLVGLNIDNIAERLLKSYHSFICLRKFNSNTYLEIRIPGGKNYHLKFDKLFALIDHVADKVLLNNNKILKPDKAYKVRKKMISYVNRALIKNEFPYMWNYKMIIRKLESGEVLTDSELGAILTKTIDKIGMIKYYYTGKKRILKLGSYLNKDYYIYLLIRYCILHKKNHSDIVTAKIEDLLEEIKKLHIYIDITKEDSVFNKIMLFKHSRDLPNQFLVDLLESVNNRTYNYLVKYVPCSTLYTKNTQNNFKKYN